MIFVVIIPPVGHYNPDLYTIAENTKLEQEDDPDLRIEKPGFNIGQARFRPSVSKKSKKHNLPLITFSKEDFIPIELKARTQENFRRKMIKM